MNTPTTKTKPQDGNTRAVPDLSPAAIAKYCEENPILDDTLLAACRSFALKVDPTGEIARQACTAVDAMRARRRSPQ